MYSNSQPVGSRLSGVCCRLYLHLCCWPVWKHAFIHPSIHPFIHSFIPSGSAAITEAAARGPCDVVRDRDPAVARVETRLRIWRCWSSCLCGLQMCPIDRISAPLFNYFDCICKCHPYIERQCLAEVVNSCTSCFRGGSTQVQDT